MVRRNVPLAHQVILEILARIDSGDLARGDGLLPSEAELSQRFEVSRATIREALSKLELAGVIVRRHGVGTFVTGLASRAPSSVQGWFDEAQGFMDFIRSANREADCQILRTVIEPAGMLADCLGLGPGSEVVLIEKLFRSASISVIHCVNAVPLGLVEPGFAGRACTLYETSSSTYQFLQLYCRQRVHHQQSEINAVAADDRLANLLHCPPGLPLLRVSEVGYTADLQPIFYGLNHFRGDMISFRQVRRPMLAIAEPLPPSGDPVRD